MPDAVREGQSNARERILEATWRLLETSPDLKVRIADIAAAAGVSRQAVYFHFGDRANLLLAAVRHRDAAAGVPKAFADAARRSPLPGALAKFVEAWFAYTPHIQPVVRLLSAASQLDPEKRIAWEDRMSNLRALTLTLAGRLADGGFLQPGWTRQAAADWIWHRTHIDGWHHLVHERGWDAADFAARTARSLERDLLVDR